MAAALAYQGDTIANPHESRSLDCFLAREARYLAPQFCRSRRKPRYSAGFQAEPGANCGSWVRLYHACSPLPGATKGNTLEAARIKLCVGIAQHHHTKERPRSDHTF